MSISRKSQAVGSLLVGSVVVVDDGCARRPCRTPARRRHAGLVAARRHRRRRCRR